MTNAERTKQVIDQLYKFLEDGTVISVDQLRDTILMNNAITLADIADSLAAIKEKLMEESK